MQLDSGVAHRISIATTDDRPCDLPSGRRLRLLTRPLTYVRWRVGRLVAASIDAQPPHHFAERPTSTMNVPKVPSVAMAAIQRSKVPSLMLERTTTCLPSQ